MGRRLGNFLSTVILLGIAGAIGKTVIKEDYAQAIIRAGIKGRAAHAERARNRAIKQKYSLPSNQEMLQKQIKEAKSPSVLEDHVLNPTNYERLLDRISRNAKDVKPSNMPDYLESSLEKIVEQWYGTKWKMDGDAIAPKEKKIACGYFVIRALEGLGYNFDYEQLGWSTITKKDGDWLSSSNLVKAVSDDYVKISRNHRLDGLRAQIKKDSYKYIDDYITENDLREVNEFIKKEGLKSLEEYAKKDKNFKKLEKFVRDYTFDKVKYYMNEQGDGFYVVGIDKHSAFLLKQGNKLYIIHSSEEKGKVVKQEAEDVQSLVNSNVYLIAKVFTPKTISKYLQEELKPVSVFKPTNN